MATPSVDTPPQDVSLPQPPEITPPDPAAAARDIASNINICVLSRFGEMLFSHAIQCYLNPLVGDVIGLGTFATREGNRPLLTTIFVHVVEYSKYIGIEFRDLCMFIGCFGWVTSRDCSGGNFVRVVEACEILAKYHKPVELILHVPVSNCTEKSSLYRRDGNPFPSPGVEYNKWGVDKDLVSHTLDGPHARYDRPKISDFGFRRVDPRGRVASIWPPRFELSMRKALHPNLRYDASCFDYALRWVDLENFDEMFFSHVIHYCVRHRMGQYLGISVDSFSTPGVLTDFNVNIPVYSKFLGISKHALQCCLAECQWARIKAETEAPTQDVLVFTAQCQHPLKFSKDDVCCRGDYELVLIRGESYNPWGIYDGLVALIRTPISRPGDPVGDMIANVTRHLTPAAITQSEQRPDVRNREKEILKYKLLKHICIKNYDIFDEMLFSHVLYARMYPTLAATIGISGDGNCGMFKTFFINVEHYAEFLGASSWSPECRDVCKRLSTCVWAYPTRDPSSSSSCEMALCYGPFATSVEMLCYSPSRVVADHLVSERNSYNTWGVKKSAYELVCRPREPSQKPTPAVPSPGHLSPVGRPPNPFHAGPRQSSPFSTPVHPNPFGASEQSSQFSTPIHPNPFSAPVHPNPFSVPEQSSPFHTGPERRAGSCTVPMPPGSTEHSAPAKGPCPVSWDPAHHAAPPLPPVTDRAALPHTSHSPVPGSERFPPMDPFTPTGNEEPRHPTAERIIEISRFLRRPGALRFDDMFASHLLYCLYCERLSAIVGLRCEDKDSLRAFTVAIPTYVMFTDLDIDTLCTQLAGCQWVGLLLKLYYGAINVKEYLLDAARKNRPAIFYLSRPVLVCSNLVSRCGAASATPGFNEWGVNERMVRSMITNRTKIVGTAGYVPTDELHTYSFRAFSRHAPLGDYSLAGRFVNHNFAKFSEMLFSHVCHAALHPDIWEFHTGICVYPQGQCRRFVISGHSYSKFLGITWTDLAAYLNSCTWLRVMRISRALEAPDDRAEYEAPRGHLVQERDVVQDIGAPGVHVDDSVFNEWGVNRDYVESVTKEASPPRLRLLWG